MSSNNRPTISVQNTLAEINRSQSFGSKYRIIETEEPLEPSPYTSLESHDRRHKDPRERTVSSSRTMSNNNIEFDDDQQRELLQQQAINNLLRQKQQ